MITCKKDMLNTCAPISDKKLLEVFIETARKFGVSWLFSSNLEPEHMYVSVTSAGCLVRKVHLDEYKQLTLADFKPKTKVEYVKLVGIPKLSELFEIFEADELFTKSMHDYKEVCSIEAVIRLFSNAGAYRKVETEITWQGEFKDTLAKHEISEDSDFYYYLHHKPEMIIELSHLVSNANK